MSDHNEWSEAQRLLFRQIQREARRMSRHFWWREHGSVVLTVAVSFIAAGALVALQVWLP